MKIFKKKLILWFGRFYYFLLEVGLFGGFCNKGRIVEIIVFVICFCRKNYKK